MAQRIHNEWFQGIKMPTCLCGRKHVQVYSWGEYHNAKWRTVDHFCQDCFKERVLSRLVSHASGCGCSFSFKARSGHVLPDWLKAAEQQCNVKEAA